MQSLPGRARPSIRRTMSRPLRQKLWIAGLVIAGCNVYDPSLLSGGMNGQAIAGGGFGAAGLTGQPPEDDGGAGTAGEAGAPVEPSAGAAMGGVAGQAGHTAAGQNSGGASTDGGSPSSGGGGNATGSAGKGGSIGKGGSAGSATAGSSTSGGASGSAGNAGAAQSGCALLSVPLEASTDYFHAVITLDSDTNLSNATLSARVYAPNATGGGFYLYVQQASYAYYAQSPQALTGLKDWVTISWDLSLATPSGFDKTKVRRIGIGITAGDSTAWADPTLVYVDTVTVAAPTLSFPFETVSSVNTTPTNYHVGDNAIWMNNGPNDTTAIGATISWSAKCN